MVKVTVASWLGTLIDYYDFFLAGFVAGSVWPVLFFPTGNAAIATAVSISVYATTYIVRPIGAFIFGHIGDRFGRQQTLLWTLTLAGVGMVGIAITPSYASIGYLAPALVTLFRLIFGIGIGGEWGGAIVWVGEYAAKSKWRPFWMCWVQSGVSGGRVIAGFAVAAAASALSSVDYINYGWRALFVAGAVVLVIAIVMRYKLEESPLFRALAQRRAIEKSPAITVLKLYWRRILLLGCAVNFQIAVPAILLLPFTLVYALGLAQIRHVSGITPAVISLAIGVGSIALIGGQLIGGIAGSIIGRRKTCLISALITLVFDVVYFPLLVNTLNVTNIFLASILLQAAYAPGSAVVGALVSEHFDTKYRVTGAGLCYQIGGLIGGVAGGIILPLLLLGVPDLISQWPYVTGLAVAVTLLTILGLIFSKETKGIELK
jgi:MFS family permease